MVAEKPPELATWRLAGELVNDNLAAVSDVYY